jgi:hypothetical protein
MMPIEAVGSGCNLIHQCLLHALYSFEYKWFSQVKGYNYKVEVKPISRNSFRLFWLYFPIAEIFSCLVIEVMTKLEKIGT